MGRPRKPIAQHVLDGTYRHDRHADTWQPTGEPETPDWLGPDAQALWQSIVPPLVASGVATALDAAELAALCDWWGMYRQAIDKLPTLDPDSKLYFKTQMIAVTSFKQFSAIASKFGLTPSDRAKLQVTPQKVSALDGFVRGRSNKTLDSE